MSSNLYRFQLYFLTVMVQMRKKDAFTVMYQALQEFNFNKWIQKKETSWKQNELTCHLVFYPLKETSSYFLC